MTVEVSSSSSESKSNRISNEGVSSSDGTFSLGRTENINDEGSSKEDATEEIKPAKKEKLAIELKSSPTHRLCEM